MLHCFSRIWNNRLMIQKWYRQTTILSQLRILGPLFVKLSHFNHYHFFDDFTLRFLGNTFNLNSVTLLIVRFLSVRKSNQRGHAMYLSGMTVILSRKSGFCQRFLCFCIIFYWRSGKQNQFKLKLFPGSIKGGYDMKVEIYPESKLSFLSLLQTTPYSTNALGVQMCMTMCTIPIHCILHCQNRNLRLFQSTKRIKKDLE